MKTRHYPSITESTHPIGRHALAERFAGQPLLWIDDALPLSISNGLLEARQPEDQGCTETLQIMDRANGFVWSDARAIENWLTRVRPESSAP